MSDDFRSVGLGQATSLPTVCAAAVPRAVGPLLIGAPTRGADYTARGGGSRVAGRELEIAERLGGTINSVPLAVVMLDRSGANLVAPSRLGLPEDDREWGRRLPSLAAIGWSFVLTLSTMAAFGVSGRVWLGIPAGRRSWYARY
jgi:hypothetical protein